MFSLQTDWMTIEKDAEAAQRRWTEPQRNISTSMYEIH